MNKLYKTIICALCGQIVKVTEDEFVDPKQTTSKPLKLKSNVHCPWCKKCNFILKPEREK
ncbi:hypothetical protein [Photobacterium carnosum]|uniref:hypothetical protein n=1 Tax=Photobacterium carnosum TaxID=2023717 RepID=UPI001E623641|nr:hypothetical protein [Photobacterium carnosum]MCD9529008.1 hypothetical protein [Photobacterium carnosum]MCD9554612.1 hypothetical protein [Photobacterium carnosum]MCF2152402.1 hypothetical protein [Photobacterium carnosum]MCF2216302.1 hypothetical protein [Photobacterium carnosum]